MTHLATCSEVTLQAFGIASRDRAEKLFDERIVLDAYLNALNLTRPSVETKRESLHTSTYA